MLRHTMAIHHTIRATSPLPFAPLEDRGSPRRLTTRDAYTLAELAEAAHGARFPCSLAWPESSWMIYQPTLWLLHSACRASHVIQVGIRVDIRVDICVDIWVDMTLAWAALDQHHHQDEPGAWLGPQNLSPDSLGKARLGSAPSSCRSDYCSGSKNIADMTRHGLRPGPADARGRGGCTELPLVCSSPIVAEAWLDDRRPR